MRRHERLFFPIIIVMCVCIGTFRPIPLGSQFSGFTLAPPNPAVGYGGSFNPYVFLPGLGLKAAASTYSLNSLLPFPFGGLGFGNSLFGRPATTIGLFNPLFGFGTSWGRTPFVGASLGTPLALPSLTLGISPLSASLVPAARGAAQSGTWTGSWQSTYIAFIVLWNSGPMYLNIVEDPLLGVVTGTAALQGSRYASIPFAVDGVLVNDTINLTGFLGTGYDIMLTCILTSPTTMTGFYTVLGTTIPIMDEGVINLTMNPPVLL
ncbi:MAG: hypothetical protein ACMUIS_05120 [bacterium]